MISIFINFAPFYSLIVYNKSVIFSFGILPSIPLCHLIGACTTQGIPGVYVKPRYGGIFGETTNFFHCTVLHQLNIQSATFELGIRIHGGKYSEIQAWHNLGSVNLYIRGIHELFEINKLNIHGDQTIQVYVENVSINSLFIKDKTFKKDVNFYLHDVAIRKIIMDSFYNFGYMSFKNLSPFISSETETHQKAVMLIRNSNLGRMDFIDSNLEAFQIEYENSKIDDIYVLGGKFDLSIRLPSGSKQDLNEQIRLFTGQMKKVFQNRGDGVTSLRYHSKNMEAYRKSLKWQWDNFFSRDNAEIINLTANRISNNHGHSWRVGLLSTLTCTLLFYAAYCWSVGYTPCLAPGSWNNFLDLIPYTFEFLNPLHKIDAVGEGIEGKITGLSRTIEGLSRIFIAYFVYQLIQAFRKHGKKGD